MRLSLLAVLLAAGCDTPATVTAPPPVAAPAAPSFDYSAQASKLNVIFISMDALRFDRTGAGGSTDMPNLDAFAKDAIFFTNTTSAAPWTVPSHMAMFTARWPTLHGVTNKLKPGPEGDLVFQQLAPEIPTLPEKLVDAGWKAVAFTGGAGVQAKFGYGRKFETYLDDKPFAGMDYSGPPAMDWLRTHKADHFFMFLHGYDAHGQHALLDQDPRAAVPDYKGPLDGGIEEQAKLREEGLAAINTPGDPANLGDAVTAEDIRFLTAIYDAKVKAADVRLGKFLDTVKELGLFDTSIIVLVGDHGEEFMEHHYLDHGATLCDHQLHVPMIIRFPGGEGHGQVADAVRTIDVFPTVFDALGVTPPDGINGTSLIPILQGKKLDLPIYSESDYRLFVHLRSEKKDGKKLVLDLEDGQRSLYDLVADPGEQTDLSTTDARTTYEMEQGVRSWLNTMKSDPKQFLGVEEEHIKLF